MIAIKIGYEQRNKTDRPSNWHMSIVISLLKKRLKLRKIELPLDDEPFLLCRTLSQLMQRVILTKREKIKMLTLFFEELYSDQ